LNSELGMRNKLKWEVGMRNAERQKKLRNSELGMRNVERKKRRQSFEFGIGNAEFIQFGISDLNGEGRKRNVSSVFD
jgi:hypothetical protein